MKESKKFEVTKSTEEWRRILSPEVYHVLRERGTERAFSHEYNSKKDPGIYRCAGCGNSLFSSKAKYDSGCGWPSFYEPIEENAVGNNVDKSLFMTRKEVHCARCGGHLGHVFEDGPPPTGLRY